MKTLVVGAAIVDIIMQIEKLPKSGEDVLCWDKKEMIGGCAYNVACTLLNLGVEHDLCVPVGTGMHADIIARRLEQMGYQILIREESKDNGFCLCLVESDGERTFITLQGCEGEFRQEWLRDLDMRQYENIYIAGYQMCGAGGHAIAGWLQKLSGKNIYFAPGPVITSIEENVMEQIFSVQPILHINEKEAFDFTKQATVEDCLSALYARTQNLVLVTLGEKGTIYYDGKRMHSIPSAPAVVTDTIGAGDSHIAAVIGGLSQDLSFEESIIMANHVAADIVGVQGPTITREEFEEKKRRWGRKDYE